MKKVLVALLAVTCLLFFKVALQANSKMVFEIIQDRLQGELLTFKEGVVTPENEQVVLELANEFKISLLFAEDPMLVDQSEGFTVAYHYIQNSDDLLSVLKGGMNVPTKGFVGDSKDPISHTIIHPDIKVVLTAANENDALVFDKVYLSSGNYENMLDFKESISNHFEEGDFEFADDRKQVNLVGLSIDALLENTSAVIVFSVVMLILILNRIADAQFDTYFIKRGYSHTRLFFRQNYRFLRKLIVISVVGFIMGALLYRWSYFSLFYVFKSYLSLVLFLGLSVMLMYGLIQSLLMLKTRHKGLGKV